LPSYEQGQEALRSLCGRERALLIYDSVRDEKTLDAWMPHHGFNGDVIVTTTEGVWATGWRCIQLTRFAKDEAQQVAELLLPGDTAEITSIRQQLVDRSAGLAVELCAAAKAADVAIKLGDGTKVEALLADETYSSLQLAWALLPERAQLFLRIAATFKAGVIPVELIRAPLVRSGWSDQNVSAAFADVKRRGFGTAGSGDAFDLHQVYADFARSQTVPSITSFRTVLFAGFLEAARAFTKTPADAELAARFLAHELAAELWSDIATDLRAIGLALLQGGRFANAQGWFERVVAAETVRRSPSTRSW
jgi:hypothetical protein